MGDSAKGDLHPEAEGRQERVKRWQITQYSTFLTKTKYFFGDICFAA